MRAFAIAALMFLAVPPVAVADDTASSAATATLNVTVRNIASAGGNLMLGVYDETSYATKGGTAVARKSTHVRGDRMTVTFDGIPPGVYAVKVLQDINQNGQFDMGLKGVEPFGFSGDPEIKGGLPPFADVKFTVTAGTNSIDVTLH